MTEGAMLVAMNDGALQPSSLYSDLQRLFCAGGDDGRRYAGGNESAVRSLTLRFAAVVWCRWW